MTKKTVVVTGGAGFIGSHLCERLLKDGNNVVCFDNLVTGTKDNITSLADNPDFTFVQGDIRDMDAVKKLSAFNIAEIYNLASPASVTYIMDHPIEVALVNSIGTYYLLEFALENNARFLFASSSEAYGDPKEHPQKEDYWGNVNPVGVRSGYDEGKRFGEALAMAYYRERRLDVRIVRIFNTYGPHSASDDSRIIPHFVTSALGGEPITVHGDGTQTRSFCYVTDMVDGIVALMNSNYIDPVNIGNPDEYRVIDVAHKILELTRSKSEIIFTARPEDDPSRRCPDITLAKTKLGWSPTIDLDRGLALTIEYFQENL